MVSRLKKYVFGFVFAVAVGFTQQADAAKDSYVTLGLGIYDFDLDFSDEIGDDSETLEYRVEYRGKDFWYSLFPTFGINSNIDGATYGFVGLGYDVQLNNVFYVIPGFAVGYYHDGGSKDLGGPLEFRSSLELGMQFENKNRVGVNISHISNASIYEHNPGVNSLVVNYSMPFNYFSN